MIIAVGIQHVDEVLPLVGAGAGEFYAGIVPSSWSNKYGYSVSPNRRESKTPNFVDFEELTATMRVIHEAKKQLYLTVNAHDYPGMVLDDVRKLVLDGLAAGVDGIIVADPALLLSLRNWEVRTKIILSGDYGISNMRSLDQIRELGIVNRIIFPRDILTEEMKRIIARHDCFEYEAFILNERCFFSGARCMSIHGHRTHNYCHEIFSSPWKVYSNSNLTYQEFERAIITGFWIQMRERAAACYTLGDSELYRAVSCDLCSIRKMREIGVQYLKVVSRGVDLELTRLMVQLAATIVREDPDPEEIVELYSRTFWGSFQEMCGKGFNCYRVEL